MSARDEDQRRKYQRNKDTAVNADNRSDRRSDRSARVRSGDNNGAGRNRSVEPENNRRKRVSSRAATNHPDDGNSSGSETVNRRTSSRRKD